jgi:RNA polymerase sigma factor (sigma-70 family)
VGDRADTDRTWSELMAAAQDGDGAAYARLLRELVPFLRVLVRRNAPADRTEDVVQDVLLTVHRIRHTYDPNRPFLPWLATVANRRVMDARRRDMRLRAWETPSTDLLETFADTAANRRGEVAELRTWLHHAIDDLPARQRDALRLVKLDEMTMQEASARSGQSVAAVKVNVHRGLQALRRTLRKI